ncbi:ABC transporter ATP-binding protein [Kitasatospora sp. HPMI-4]|uniref:ABC transporter ATP-binding protein n=1 Tax=Kitasatospora sp. HPMI-4 TaxID=3448443 RepID=UPI003F1D0D11
MTSPEKPAGGALLRFDNVSFGYPYRGKTRYILRQVDLELEAGRMYAVVGPSGSGKTTFLSLAAGLSSPQSGRVCYDGQDVARIGLERYRNRHVATVFQSFNLLPYMTAVQNITSAMEITGVRGVDRRKRAEELLERLGIDEEDRHRRTLQLSGGQQQRVAIARALACEVRLLCADEPTGSLDEDTARGIVEIFQELAHGQGCCVVLVTHAREVARACDQVLELRRGRLQTAG